jgi:multidrug transporter EmrE-like cation transporter
MTTTTLGILLVVLSTLIEGVGETLLKKSRLDRARQVFWVLIGVAVFIVQMAVYTAALKFLDLGAAFALSSLSFVAVALLSRLLLDEAVTPIRWLGVLLIVGGTILIGAYA